MVDVSGASVNSPTAKTSFDNFLGDQLSIEQPVGGPHRAGLDAVLLGACIGENETGTVIDLGAGVGVAGLCAAARAPACRVILVERDEQSVELARRNCQRNFGNSPGPARVSVVEIDITANVTTREAAGLVREIADHVVMNPPFHTEGTVRRSPDDRRSDAHVLDTNGLLPWIKCAATHLKPGGRITIIFRADGLDHLLRTLGRGFGNVRVKPVYPRPDAAANRILLTAVKGSRAPLAIQPGFVLHEADGPGFSAEAEAILRHGGGIEFG